MTTLHVSGAPCTHHQEYNNCICSPWHELHIGQPPSYVGNAGYELVHTLPSRKVFSGASCTHHQEYDNCICSPWYELHIGQPPSYVAGYSLPCRKVVIRCVTRTGGCIYSCHTPDNGCKKCPKHVEWSRSEIKITTQPHRVGLFNNKNYQLILFTFFKNNDCDICAFYLTTLSTAKIIQHHDG